MEITATMTMTPTFVYILIGVGIFFFALITMILASVFETGARAGPFGTFYGGLIYFGNSIAFNLGGLAYTMPVSLVVALLGMFICYPNTREWTKDRWEGFLDAIWEGSDRIFEQIEHQRTYRKAVTRAKAKLTAEQDKPADKKPPSGNISDDIFD